MAAGAHFGCPKITFDRISGHFISIRNLCLILLQNGHRCPFWMSEIHFRWHFWSFQIDTQLFFFFKFLTKWLTSAILNVRNSLSIAFLAISDQSSILDVRNSLSIAILAISDRYRIFFGGNFGCPKITLDRISDHIKSIGHFGCPKFTFDGISGHFRSIWNFF